MSTPSQETPGLKSRSLPVYINSRTLLEALTGPNVAADARGPWAKHAQALTKLVESYVRAQDMPNNALQLPEAILFEGEYARMAMDAIRYHRIAQLPHAPAFEAIKNQSEALDLPQLEIAARPPSAEDLPPAA